MEMMEMFSMIDKSGISPNQFYLLYCMKENIASSRVNIHQELRYLIGEGFVKEQGGICSLTPKSISLVEEIESFFKVTKKKTTKQVLGDDFDSKIDEYLSLFPRIKLPSGKSARSDKRNMEIAFKWFFENHKYSWDTILKATAKYVNECELRTPSYLYMQTSQYFVRKQATDKTWGSELANCCSAIDLGDDSSDKPRFVEKVT